MFSEPMTQDTLKLHIDSMAFGGRGIGRHEGKVWFVEDTIVGDHVSCQSLTDHKRYGDAKVLSYLKESPLREHSRCSFAKKCGGCQWLEVSESHQLAWKRSFVTSALKRIGKLPSLESIEISPSPQKSHYRNRITLQGTFSKANGCQVGYYRRHTHDIISIDQCFVAHASINQVIDEINAMNLTFTENRSFRLQLQAIPHTNSKNNDDVIATFYPVNGMTNDAERFIDALKNLSKVIWAGSVFEAKRSEMVLFDKQFDIPFYTIAGMFQQINKDHNYQLREIVKEIVLAEKPRSLIDVFCGNGNLSLGLANSLEYLEGVESNPLSIACAKRSAKELGLNTVHYLSGDATAHLWKCARNNESFDVAIVDPPRQGMYKGIIPLKKLAPKTIIYVSCDPTTLARDLGALCRKQVYRVESIKLFDFFPHTYHVESLVVLKKNQ